MAHVHVIFVHAHACDVMRSAFAIRPTPAPVARMPGEVINVQVERLKYSDTIHNSTTTASGAARHTISTLQNDGPVGSPDRSLSHMWYEL